MDLAQLLVDPPRLHMEGGQLVSSLKLANEELALLDRLSKPDLRTIETGAGLSTIVFAMKGTAHTCVVIEGEVADRIKEWCEAKGVDTSKIRFVIAPSDRALPRLIEEGQRYDLALIDGSHAFPMPFVDWHYVAEMLEVGGLLVLDDIQIWTCEVLAQFLLMEPNWALVEESLSGMAFRKIASVVSEHDHHFQPYVVARGREMSLVAKGRYLTGLLQRRNYGLFRSTVSLGLQSLRQGRFGKRESR